MVEEGGYTYFRISHPKAPGLITQRRLLVGLLGGVSMRIDDTLVQSETDDNDQGHCIEQPLRFLKASDPFARDQMQYVLGMAYGFYEAAYLRHPSPKDPGFERAEMFKKATIELVDKVEGFKCETYSTGRFALEDYRQIVKELNKLLEECGDVVLRGMLRDMDDEDDRCESAVACFGKKVREHWCASYQKYTSGRIERMKGLWEASKMALEVVLVDPKLH